jgi:hypothetical protein
MKKALKKVLWFLVFAFIVIQFFHPEKNISTEILATDISKNYSVPADVQVILSKACYDCHSNNTRYPWYNNIQPVTWWLNSHIKEAKEGLNFSEFTKMPLDKQSKRMQQCINLVKKNAMPLSSYTLIHKDAILTDAEKETFYNWCNAVKDSIKAKTLK